MKNYIHILRFSFLLVVFLACNKLIADDLATILTQLAENKIVKSDFEQIKTIATIKKPLLTSGKLVFNQKQGVLWLIEKPVVANIIVSAKRMVQKTNRSETKIELNHNPYGQIATLAFQLMSGNTNQLRDVFEIAKIAGTSNDWLIVLHPKDNKLLKLFSIIKVSGDKQYINQIELVDAYDSKTIIQFKNQQNNQNISETENELFKLVQ